MSYSRNLARIARKGVITVAAAQELRDLMIYGGNFPETVETLGALAAGDGGGGLWRWDGSSSAADNLGTVLLPSGHTGAGRWVRVVTSAVLADWFGVPKNGAADASQSLQDAIDAAEAIGLPLNLDAIGNYLLNGTVYLGNVSLHTNGALITIQSDLAWTERGTTPRKGEGAILTKSAANAGYGVTAIRLVIDELRIQFNRPVDGQGPVTACLLENVDSFECSRIDITTGDTDAAKSIFDLYSGCQNVHIGTLKGYVRNQTKIGGVWIRNFSTTRATTNVHIDRIVLDHVGVDEAIAIFNSPKPATGDPEVSHIHISDLTISSIENGISIHQNFPGGTRIKDIHIDKLKIQITSMQGASPFGFKVDGVYNCSIGDLQMSCSISSAATGSIFLIRQIGTDRNTWCYITNVNLNVSGNASAIPVNGVSGRMYVDNLEINIASGVEITNGLSYNDAPINNVVIAGKTAKAILSCYSINGTVEGRMEGVENFSGVQICNTDNHANAIWNSHSAATRLPQFIRYNGFLKVTGSNAVTNLFSITGVHTPKIPVQLHYAYEDAGGRVTTAAVIQTAGFFKLENDGQLIV